jgi:peptidyl-prolyl cis-trans isomerase SurA
MLFKIKVIKFISSLLLAVFFIQNTTAQKVKIDAVGVVVGKNIVLDSDIEKFKLELENNSEGKIKISDCEMCRAVNVTKITCTSCSGG